MNDIKCGVCVLPSALPRIDRNGLHRGVFALRDFQPGELVCFFDGFPKPTDRRLTDLERSLLLEDTVGRLIPDKGQPFGVAQILNDSDVLDVLTDFPVGKDQREQVQWVLGRIQRYEACAIKCHVSNAQACDPEFSKKTPYFRGESFYCVQPIKAGQEIFFHYGTIFWLEYAMNTLSEQLEQARAILLSKAMLQMVHANIFVPFCAVNRARLVPKNLVTDGFKLGCFVQMHAAMLCSPLANGLMHSLEIPNDDQVRESIKEKKDLFQISRTPEHIWLNEGYNSFLLQAFEKFRV